MTALHLSDRILQLNILFPWLLGIRNCRSEPTHVAEHFIFSPNHSASDMQLIPLEKIITNRDAIRKAREATLIHRARTLEPTGLNKREETP